MPDEIKLNPNSVLAHLLANTQETTIRMSDDGGDVLKLEAADSADGAAGKLKNFSITAYTGGKLDVGFGLPVVVDLSGMRVSAKSRPVLKDHNAATIVGHTTDLKINAGSIVAKGVVSSTGDAAREVTESSANGFPWQASIGASVTRMVEVGGGESVQVNGRTFKGPLLVARQSTLKEISFVALGADDNTNARVAAKGRDANTEIIAMEFEKWLEAQGLKLADLSEDSVAKLKATHKHVTELEAAGTEKPEKDAGKAKPDTKPATVNATFNADDEIAKIRAEQTRLVAIRAAAKGNADIEAKAIEGEWDAERVKIEVELAELRAGRPQAPSVNTGEGEVGLTGTVVEAAISLAGGLEGVEKQYDEKTLDAAQKHYKGRIGLQEMLVEAARANGYTGGYSFRRDPRGVLRAAFSQNIHAASGFSTLSVTDILSNTANKFLLAGFNAVESAWRSISSTRNVSDFKQITSYRLTGDNEYEEVGPGGEIKHGSLGDESFTNQAKTYAKMLAITRNDLINDDLGALTAVPRGLGRGSGLKLNKVFWTAFLDNSDFFKSANNNISTTTPLSIDGLTAAELLFLDQTDPDGNPLALMPSILLVPNALHVLAGQIMKSTGVNEFVTDDDASSISDRQMVGNANPHAGKFSVVRSAYLSDSTISGSSTADWYLLANPSDLPVIETAFLDGKQAPTVETADADFSTLGIQMRGYHDFGVAKQEYRAGVKGDAA